MPAYHLYYKRNTPRPISYTNRIWSHVQTLRNLITKGFRPDIIHAHVYRAGAMGIILGKLFKIPVVITEHYTAFPRRQLSKYSILEARFAFRFAKCVMPVSYALSCKVSRDYGMKANFQIVPCVVNTDIFYPREGLQRFKYSKRSFCWYSLPTKEFPFI
ncbi:MAG: glycosyltransferase [Chloroflexi bacterium]|nr:glycosyltransferase [Chloroflexota bacterium]